MNWLLIGTLVAAFAVLISSGSRARIKAVAFQGAMLSALYIAAMEKFSIHSVLLVLITFAIKTIAIPIMIIKAFRKVSDKLAENEPSVNFSVTVLGGCIITILSFTSVKFLPAFSAQLNSTLSIPVALATLLIGFWILVTKTKATNQVIGFLVLENGVFVFGMTIVSDFPMMVELGVLLDLLVGVFVMGIMVYHINKTFDHIDTRTLTALTDE